MNVSPSRWRRAVVVTAAAALATGGLAAAPVSPALAQAGCLTVAQHTDTWSTGNGGGFVTTVTLTNECAEVIPSWTLEVTLAPGVVPTAAWSAQWIINGSQLVATGLSWNSTLNPGASTSFGYLGTYSNGFQAPVSCLINGVACDGSSGGNVPPEVVLTAPVDGGYQRGMCPIRLSAVASDPDGAVDRVEFYVNDVLVGVDHTAPYEVEIAHNDPALGPPSGNTAYARAYDDGTPALTADSAVATFVIAPIPPALMIVSCTPQLTVVEGGTAEAVFTSACGHPTEVDLSVTGDPGVTVSPSSFTTGTAGTTGFGDRVTVSAAPGTAGGSATITARAVNQGCLSAGVAVSVVPAAGA